MCVPEVLGIQVHFGNPKAFGNLEGNHLTRGVDVGGRRQGLGGLDSMRRFCPCEPHSPHTPTLLLVCSMSLLQLDRNPPPGLNSEGLLYFSSLRAMGTFLVLC